MEIINILMISDYMEVIYLIYITDSLKYFTLYSK